MVVKSVKGFVFIPVILIVVFILLVAYKVYKGNKGQLGTPTITSKKENLQINKISLTGMVWTSGLIQEEKETLGIYSEYQITKTLQSEFQNGWENKTDGMYLVGNNIDYSKYLGKCVTVSGEIVKGWENISEKDYEINGKWTYGRSAMSVQKIQINDFDKCLKSYDRNEGDINEKEYQEYTGILSYSKRPAPDINYDFAIILDQPYLDEFNASGKSVLMKQIDVSEENDEIYRIMLENVGKRVKAVGYWRWGYAESRFLRVDKLKII